MHLLRMTILEFSGRRKAHIGLNLGSCSGSARLGPSLPLRLRLHLVSGHSIDLLGLPPDDFLLPNLPVRTSQSTWLTRSRLVGRGRELGMTGQDLSVPRDGVLGGGEAAAIPLPSRPQRRRIRRLHGDRRGPKKPEDPPPPLVPVVSAMAKIKDPILDNDSGLADHVKSEQNEEEKEWTDEDFELLKRQISKHPVGKPRRWERIAEAFRGQHGLDSVITAAKSLSEKRPASGDSYQQFLKQRKPVDKRVVAAELELPLQVGENGDSTKENGGGAEKWSSGEDIALLNALKTFPKDVSMRWEKVAAAVPGKSKAACMKRVAELKRNFRTSKVTDA
ncbi:hypothetical protein ZIOFF_038022 [Zingiber officinale]|uniref:Myb-like domain-containing protein n=1 Tax=Zingiber officinale TaxID=94328 RepID=A0A8J5GL85_ZINOF|nr:hypothetical protein ZIOFF_038022 [Zingiber officinale]